MTHTDLKQRVIETLDSVFDNGNEADRHLICMSAIYICKAAWPDFDEYNPAAWDTINQTADNWYSDYSVEVNG